MARLSALSVKNVTKNFGGLIAVNQMSFNIEEREVLGLIGPNGSGKTTMMNLISGALRLSEGSISLDGQFISSLTANQINQRGIARTFQLVRILPSLTVVENCMAGMVFGHRRIWGDKARADPSMWQGNPLYAFKGLRVGDFGGRQRVRFDDGSGEAHVRPARLTRIWRPSDAPRVLIVRETDCYRCLWCSGHAGRLRECVC